MVDFFHNRTLLKRSHPIMNFDKDVLQQILSHGIIGRPAADKLPQLAATGFPNTFGTLYHRVTSFLPQYVKRVIYFLTSH